MGSFTLPILLRWLDGAVVRLRGGRPFPPCGGGIRLLDPSAQPLSPGHLHLGTPEEAAQVLSSGALPQEGAAIVSSAGPSPLGERPLPGSRSSRPACP